MLVNWDSKEKPTVLGTSTQEATNSKNSLPQRLNIALSSYFSKKRMKSAKNL